MSKADAAREQIAKMKSDARKPPTPESAKLEASKTEVARQQVAATRRDIENMKLVKKNPVPALLNMPELSGDAEADSAADLTELQAGFRNRAAAESDRFALATDSEYWTCFCFQTREQKEHFLAALNILQFGDRYLDGAQVAKVLGVTLPAANVPYKTSAKVDPTWVEFVKK